MDANGAFKCAKKMVIYVSEYEIQSEVALGEIG